jgi:hypothetical protein
MHAKHADGDRLNDLSGPTIDGAFTVLKTLGTGFFEKSVRKRWRMKRVARICRWCSNPRQGAL